MSKKIAEGTSSLVLDVKVGSGAFMKTLDRANELATVLVQLGKDAGVNTSALLTDMSTPLGKKIGNSLEVEESVEVLSGGGPADVVELTVELAREMLLTERYARRGPSRESKQRQSPGCLAEDDFGAGWRPRRDTAKGHRFAHYSSQPVRIHIEAGSFVNRRRFLEARSRKRAQGGSRSSSGPVSSCMLSSATT